MKPEARGGDKHRTGWWSTVVLILAGLWRFVEHWADVDFLLSLRSEKAAFWFILLRDYGIWVIAIVAVALLFGRPRPTVRAVGLEFVIVAATFAMLGGILMGMLFTKSSPRQIITEWAYTMEGCVATFDTAQLASLSEKYDVVLICGAKDSSVDTLEDTGITKSKAFTITGGRVQILAPYTSSTLRQMKKLLASQPYNVLGLTIWFDPVIIPKETPLERITRLSDIPRFGGRVLEGQHKTDIVKKP